MYSLLAEELERDRIHPTAAEGFRSFGRRVRAGAARNPAEALKPLRSSADMNVLELAAGTGKLTRLLARGADGGRCRAPGGDASGAPPVVPRALDGPAERNPPRGAVRSTRYWSSRHSMVRRRPSSPR